MRIAFGLNRLFVASTAAFASALLASSANASNVTEFPDNGSEQMGRGGAWVARASDPLAAFYNPAGLAGQPTAITLQMNLNIRSTCFTRLRATNDATQDSSYDPATGLYPKVCNDTEPFPDPQIAFTYRVSDRVGLGFAVLGPSAAGQANWPDTVEFGGQTQPSPQRYLLLNSNLLLLTPTLAFGAEVAPGLRLGASFQFGLMKAKFANASLALNQGNLAAGANDVHATIIVGDYFIPGFTLGALYSPTNNLDIGAWFKWSDSIKATGDVYTQVGYFTDKANHGDGSTIKDGDSSLANCGDGSTSTTCGSGNNAHLKLTIPMEAKLGLRFHLPRHAEKKSVRDPIADDIFDAEVDATWANNSAIENLEIRFPDNGRGDGVIPVNGTPGSVPPSADVPHKFKDVFGVRVGGDYNVLPDQLAIRAGAFFESNGQDPQYQNIDFMGAQRIGLALGATYRLHLGESKRPLEFHVGFMHVFVAKQENLDPNNQGIPALAGTTCDPNEASPPAGMNCGTGLPKYRSNWASNLGTITNTVNLINLGATYRFE